MRSTVVMITIGLVVSACDTRSGTISAQLAPVSVPVAASRTPTPAPPGPDVRLVLPPDHVDVAGFVSHARTEAASQHRRVLVYVGAEWCPPCQAFQTAVETHRLDRAFPDLTLLEFDYDLDAERLRAAGYASRLVPYFTVPAADGRATEARIEGSMRDAESVEQIVPRLHALLGD